MNLNPHPATCDVIIGRKESDGVGMLTGIKFESLPRVGESVCLPGEGNTVFVVENVLHLARGSDRDSHSWVRLTVKPAK